MIPDGSLSSSGPIRVMKNYTQKAACVRAGCFFVLLSFSGFPDGIRNTESKSAPDNCDGEDEHNDGH